MLSSLSLPWPYINLALPHPYVALSIHLGHPLAPPHPYYATLELAIVSFVACRVCSASLGSFASRTLARCTCSHRALPPTISRANAISAWIGAHSTFRIRYTCAVGDSCSSTTLSTRTSCRCHVFAAVANGRI